MRLSRKSRTALRLLQKKGRTYGLKLVKGSGGSLKRGTVYVLLARLEDRGFVRSEQEKDPGRPGLPRRFFEITEEGRRALATWETLELGISNASA